MASPSKSAAELKGDTTAPAAVEDDAPSGLATAPPPVQAEMGEQATGAGRLAKRGTGDDGVPREREGEGHTRGDPPVPPRPRATEKLEVGEALGPRPNRAPKGECNREELWTLCRR